MADILPSYTFAQSVGRYRDVSTGRFVSRDNITKLTTAYVNDAESRLGELTNSYAEGKMSASSWTVSMRDEMRRLTLAAEALGANGINNLTPQQTGRSGQTLREQYARISSNADQFQRGEISQAQLLARVNAMTGEARAHYWAAEREAARPQEPNGVLIERRITSGGETCPDCVEYYNQGWQRLGDLPLPTHSSVCRGNCKCRIERKEIDGRDLAAWIGTKR